MGLFGRKKGTGDREIDELINSIRVDLSNNYKDNAVLTLKKLKTVVEEKHSSGKLKEERYSAYLETVLGFEKDIASFKRTY